MSKSGFLGAPLSVLHTSWDRSLLIDCDGHEVAVVRISEEAEESMELCDVFETAKELSAEALCDIVNMHRPLVDAVNMLLEEGKFYGPTGAMVRENARNLINGAL